MIVIDNQKFACSACINGHRSSSCNHTERPLFEVKKKGRPVSQCERCRTLRKTRSYHEKCVCNKPEAEQVPTSSNSQPKEKQIKNALRRAPTTPALPNGVKDILGSESEQYEGKNIYPYLSFFFTLLIFGVPAGDDSRESSRGRTAARGSFTGSTAQESGGMHSAEAAHVPDPSPRRASPSHRILPPPEKSNILARNLNMASQPPSSCCNQPGTNPLGLSSRALASCHLPSISTWTSTPPLLHSLHITTTSDSCGCGKDCMCAGCVQHRGAVAAAAAIAAGHGSCPDRCQTCQDQALTGMHISPAPVGAEVESLLTRALAKLPPPPSGRLGVFQSTMGGKQVALVYFPASILGAREDLSAHNARSKRPREALSSEGEDSLTDADAEGEVESASSSQAQMRLSIVTPSPPASPLSAADNVASLSPRLYRNNDWALAQLEVDEETELGMAVDAISPR